MYLVNARTGQKLLLAKYSPATGWVTQVQMVEVDIEFDKAEEDFSNIVNGDFAPHSLWGDCGWQIEYEMKPSDLADQSKDAS